MTQEHKPPMEIKTYATAQFWLNEGYYTIQDLEDILKRIKEAKALQDAHLRRSMGDIK